MLSLVSEALEAYAQGHTTPRHPVYEALREVTLRESTCPQMQVGPVEGTLLTLLARLTGARRAVEVGTFTGYSALSIAEGMVEGGHLTTCDIDPVATAVARTHWAKVPWGDRIHLELAPAIETLRSLEGPLDLAFVDADKGGYIHYWEAIVPLLRPGGVIVVDNVLWSGTVLEPREQSDHAIVSFNAHSQSDERVDQVMLTVRDGILLGVRR